MRPLRVGIWPVLLGPHLARWEKPGRGGDDERSVAAETWARKNRWRVPAVITLLNAVVAAELLDRNPFAGLSHKGEGRKRIAPLTVGEVNELAQAARGRTARGRSS